MGTKRTAGSERSRLISRGRARSWKDVDKAVGSALDALHRSGDSVEAGRLRKQLSVVAEAVAHPEMQKLAAAPRVVKRGSLPGRALLRLLAEKGRLDEMASQHAPKARASASKRRGPKKVSAEDEGPIDVGALARALPIFCTVTVRWEATGPAARVLIDREDRGVIGSQFPVMSGTHRFKLSLSEGEYSPAVVRRQIDDDDEIVFAPGGP